MKILLTGYSGFLGRYLYQALRAEHCEIRILLHRHSIGRQELDCSTEVFWGSIDNPATVRQALDGVDCVVHAAWMFSPPFATRPTINETAAECLLRESIYAGVTGFAFISSVAVYGMQASGPDPIDESSSLARGRELQFIYPAEKISIETSLQHADRRGTALAIFRPGPVFDDARPPVFKTLRLGKTRLGIGLGNGTNRMAYIHARDVADAVCLWLVNSADEGIYNIVPSTCLQASQWGPAWSALTGNDLKPVFIPSNMIRGIFYGKKAFLRFLGRPDRQDVSYAIRCGVRDMIYLNTCLKDSLQWRDSATAAYTSCNQGQTVRPGS